MYIAIFFCIAYLTALNAAPANNTRRIQQITKGDGVIHIRPFSSQTSAHQTHEYSNAGPYLDNFTKIQQISERNRAIFVNIANN